MRHLDEVSAAFGRTFSVSRFGVVFSDISQRIGEEGVMP